MKRSKRRSRNLEGRKLKGEAISAAMLKQNGVISKK